MLERIKNEPARVTGFALAVLMMARSYGLPITEQQIDLTISAIGAGLFLLGAEVVRPFVVPVRKLAGK